MFCSILIRVSRQLSSLYNDQMASFGIEAAQKIIRYFCSKLQNHH